MPTGSLIRTAAGSTQRSSSISGKERAAGLAGKSNRSKGSWGKNQRPERGDPDTELHSKAHRGGEEEPTQTYAFVRQGERRGANKDGAKKAAWYDVYVAGRIRYFSTKWSGL